MLRWTRTTLGMSPVTGCRGGTAVPCPPPLIKCLPACDNIAVLERMALRFRRV